MFRPLSIFVGARYTRAKRRNHYISFISLTSMIGLALGVLAMIVVLSVMNGFQKEMSSRILGMVPHATLSARSLNPGLRSRTSPESRHPSHAGQATPHHPENPAKPVKPAASTATCRLQPTGQPTPSKRPDIHGLSVPSRIQLVLSPAENRKILAHAVNAATTGSDRAPVESTTASASRTSASHE